MRTVLHVGCGAATIEKMTAGFQDDGWREIRLDIDPAAKPDILGTLLDMDAVRSGSVDAIYSSHSIEHVETFQVDTVLSEFLRVLKPDGFLVVTCPDIEQVAKHVAQGRLAETLYESGAGPITALDILYGHGASIQAGQPYMAHRTAFTLTTLQAGLVGAGFQVLVLKRRPVHLDLWAVAFKSAVTKEAATELVARYLPA